MNTTFCVVAALIVAGNTAAAQIPDTAKIVVYYKFTHVSDTLNKANPYTENMMLLVGPNASLYKSYDRKTRLERMQVSANNRLAGGSYSTYRPQASATATTNEGSAVAYYYFLNEQKAFRTEEVLNTYVLAELALPPVWRIVGDTTTIGGYHCQKATTHFKGRNYIAWFTPDLPFRAGPWKLNNLPGLILQAKDQNDEVMFVLDKVERVDIQMKIKRPMPAPTLTSATGIRVTTIVRGLDYKYPEALIMLPEKAFNSTEKELARIKMMRDTDPEGFLQASMTAAGVPAPPAGTGRALAAQLGATKKNVVNNPIELPESKKHKR